MSDISKDYSTHVACGPAEFGFSNPLTVHARGFIYIFFITLGSFPLYFCSYLTEHLAHLPKHLSHLMGGIMTTSQSLPENEGWYGWQRWASSHQGEAINPVTFIRMGNSQQ